MFNFNSQVILDQISCRNGVRTVEVAHLGELHTNHNIVVTNNDIKMKK